MKYYIDEETKKIIIEAYGQFDKICESLNKIGVKFTTEDFRSNFWGKRFIITKPTGKGSRKIIADILKIYLLVSGFIHIFTLSETNEFVKL